MEPMSNPDYLVCDFHAHLPGSEIISCTECGRDMRISSSGLKMLVGNPALVPICLFCAPQPERGEIQPMTPEQETEILAAGVTPEEIAELYERFGVLKEE